MLSDDLHELLQLQDGVVARRQILTADARPSDIERLLRRRDLVRMLPGVFINHTGDPTWHQRAWAGVLYAWPAALSHQSALRAAAGPGWRAHNDGDPISLAIDDRRRIVSPIGYSIHRTVGLQSRVQWQKGPPRVRIEEAVIDVAAMSKTDFEAIEVLAAACQSRRTTAERCLAATEGRVRLRRRQWLVDVLGDIASGTCSVLEHTYLHAVERAHGLPTASRQSHARLDRGSIYRDVDYEQFGLIVELDGRLFHDSARQRDADLDRDLDALVDGRRSVRLGWGQVFERACRTAYRVARLLQAGGWVGQLRQCGPGCGAQINNPESATYQAR